MHKEHDREEDILPQQEIVQAQGDRAVEDAVPREELSFEQGQADFEELPNRRN